MTGASEAFAQSAVRLEAGRLPGVTLWRNNVGVLTNAETNRPVRFGLANESKEMNALLKSSDLIGWRSVLIRPEHVGRVFAVFLARECKHPGWVFTGTEREIAQKRFIDMVTAAGGDAAFAAGPGTL